MLERLKGKKIWINWKSVSGFIEFKFDQIYYIEKSDDREAYLNIYIKDLQDSCFILPYDDSVSCGLYNYDDGHKIQIQFYEKNISLVKLLLREADMIRAREWKNLSLEEFIKAVIENTAIERKRRGY